MNTIRSLLAAMALLAAAIGFDVTPAVAADTAPTVKVQGLRQGLPLNQDAAPGNFRQERDHPVSDRDFVQMPDRKSTRLNSSHSQQSRMPSSA